MRSIIPFLFCLVTLAFVSDKPDLNHFRSLFPEVIIHQNDSVHVGPDDYYRGTQDTNLNYYFHRILENKSEVNYNERFSGEHFSRPVFRSVLNGLEIFVIEFGDTNHVAIYEGKDVFLYAYDPKVGFHYGRELASTHAGEGPYYETDSWLTDLNHDGFVDILTREIGQYMQQEEINGGEEWNLILVDEMSACTLRDTGYVFLTVPNPDSLRNIYRNYHYQNR